MPGPVEVPGRTTEIRRSREEFAADHQRLHDVLEMLPVYAVLLTPDYQVALDNRFFRERFGESKGRRCYEYLFNRSEPCEVCETYTVLKTGQPHRWQWTGPDGRNYDIHDFPFTDASGARLILEVGLDVTERKRAETELTEDRDRLVELVSERAIQLELANLGLREEIEERKRVEAELRQSRADMDRAQEVGQIGSWRLDVRRNVLTWSDETHRIFGVPKGTPLTYELFLGMVHPDDREYVDKQWNAGMRGEPYDVEHRIVVDGRVKWVREKAYLEFDESGALLGGFGIAQDITERKLMEEERARQSRMKDEFLALLGHELRNPLATIATTMHLLTNSVTPAQRTSLDAMMRRQVAVLQRLVDDLLDLARVTHGQIELQKERIDLPAFLQRAMEAARSSVAGRGQELILRLPTEHVVFVADEVRLEQIVANLLGNASKYTHQGGRIELSGARERGQVVIRCKDNGRGIPREMQDVIFEPFTRVRRPGESQEWGVGIGLALVKRLVELQGGSVSVESGGAVPGSEFTVRLPLVEPPPLPPEAAEGRPGPRVRRKLSVVVVEDNPDVARSLTIALEQAGHAVRLFTDGPAALAGLGRLKPSAMLLDVGLPGMDGYELAARLRKRRALDQTLLIGMSGFKRREQGGKPDGAFDHYFIKPIEVPRLLMLLETEARGGAAKKPEVSRVLLVEDNAELSRATADMLRREGLEVRTALSGGEALEAAADFPAELVLCDLHLPDMSAEDVLKGLRSKPATSRARAVVLTALAESDVRALDRRAKDMGVDQFVSKPLTCAKLKALLSLG